jgi:starvation-inducible DNA-binding protein
MTNKIGLNNKDCLELSSLLNGLLSNYQVLYMNVRGFHWNIKGSNFFELHVKFEEIYNNLQLKIDEIAERILTLGFSPLHSYSDYLSHSSVKEHTNVSDGKQAMAEVLHSYEIIIGLQRILLAKSAESGDEGTNALMSDYIREQEKQVWMYSAYLNR